MSIWRRTESLLRHTHWAQGGRCKGGGASEVGCWVLGQTRLAWLVSESGAPARNSALSCPLRLAELNREGRSAASISRRAAQVDRS